MSFLKECFDCIAWAVGVFGVIIIIDLYMGVTEAGLIVGILAGAIMIHLIRRWSPVRK